MVSFIWSTFFFFLIFYISIFVTNYKSQLKKIKNDISIFGQKVEYLFSDFPYIMNNTYYSIKDMKNILNNFDKNNFYHDSLNNIFNLCNEIKT